MKSLTLKKMLFSLVLSISASVFATSIIELSLKDLSEKSDNIVVARAISVQSYFVESEKRIYSKIELQVIQTLKGETRAFDELTLTVLGGTYNGITTVVVGAPNFTIDERTILFLISVTLPDGKKNYVVTGLSQGKFNIVTENQIDKVVREQITVPLKSEKNTIPLQLTSKDAIQFSDFVNEIKKYAN